MVISSLCPICKRSGHSQNDCPMVHKAQAMMKAKQMNVNTDFSADAPSVFVGHYGYPKVHVGVMSPPEKKEDAWLYDAPQTWAKRNYGVHEVINFRGSLLNSRFQESVKQPAGEASKTLETAQEVSQASRPVDVEVLLEDKPKFNMQFDSYSAPNGPNAPLEKVDITTNPYITKQVDKRVSDTDLKAGEALVELAHKGYDENFLMQLMSVGNLGIGKQRSLVPTRWSITAVDDTLGKDLIDEIKNYEMIQPSLYFGGYLGNYYVVMLFEELWSYELFEGRVPETDVNSMQFSTDFESYGGRTNYATDTVGGYYAARLSLLEKLKELKKQGTALVLRFVTDEYTCPLGVWVVREAVRNAVSGKRHTFETKEQMIAYAKFILKKKFGYDIEHILKDSKIYKQLEQVKLVRYFQ